MAYPMVGGSSPDRTALPSNAFSKRLSEFKTWRDELIQIIQEYQAWVETQGLGNGEDDLRIYELIDQLRSDQLVIALVAEFSRGKTELINAIFFADYKQRLLPSDAGRTTMCPTELLYDAKQPPCIRLLPIETRKTQSTIAEYRRNSQAWTVVPLELDNPKKMSEAFLQIARTQTIPVREAEELGLYTPGAPGFDVGGDGKVQIPVWRHAIINFPHPLLKQGLVIIDTPGLNSLGTEPELTLNLLPRAHAVLFVLAADTGVTKSDLDVWTNHVRNVKNALADGRIVVLNKIDTLWDELRTLDAIASSLERQMQETARALGVTKAHIFPVSAQKGLLGKIKTDQTLLTKSGLQALELKLSRDIITSKQALLRERVAREIGAVVDSTRAMIEGRLTAIDAQLAEMRSLSGKNQEAIQSMIAQMRNEKQAYDKTLASFQSTRAVLSDQTKLLLDYLSVESFDALIGRTRNDMKESWTTHGLKVGMKTLFDGALEAMERAHAQAQQIRGLVLAIYNKFHADHGLAKVRPAEFQLDTFRKQLQQLHAEAEAFRASPIMVMTEQHFVIKKFFITLVSRARQTYTECNVAAQNWSKAVMAPILSQVREHKIMMDHRLENLKRVHENLDNLSGRISDLEATKLNLENQLSSIRAMLRKLSDPLH